MNQDELFEIFQFLEPEEILNLSTTCILFYQVSNNNTLWKLLMKNFLINEKNSFSKKSKKINWKEECFKRKKFKFDLKKKEKILYSKLPFIGEHTMIIGFKNFYNSSFFFFNIFKNPTKEFYMIELKENFYFLLGNFQYSKKNVQSFQSMELLRNQFVPIFPINFKSLIHIEILERIENRILSFKSNKNLIEMLYLLKFDEYFEVCDQKKKMIELKINLDEFGKLKETEGNLEIKLFGFVNKIEFNYKISTFYSVELKVNENDFELDRILISNIEESLNSF